MNDFLDYCFGITLLMFGLAMLIISVGLVCGYIK
jgi:hypothetical protein